MNMWQMAGAEWLSLEDASSILGDPVDKLTAMIAVGELPARLVDDHYEVHTSTVDDLVWSRTGWLSHAVFRLLARVVRRG